MEPKEKKGRKAAMGRVVERPYWLLGLSIVARAAHQFGAAVFLVSFLFPEWILPSFYLVLAVVSGVALTGLEFMRHRQLFRELAGTVTVVKMLLLGAAYHGLAAEVPLVVTAFFLASVGAHAPKNIRHRLLF